MSDQLAKLVVVIGANTKQFEDSMQKMQQRMKVAGVAMTAIGAAGLKLVDSARKINAQLGSTAITIGATTKEMRGMVLETANVTFGIESVTKTFDLLARAGVKSQAELKASATAFDTLGDAIGSNAESVAKQLIPAFKNLGVQIPQNADDLDAFTWLVKNTTVNLEDFSQAMSYVAAYGSNLNLTIDEMVSIMAALEAKGISGSAVTRVFRTAINQAASGAMTLNEALELSQEEIDAFSGDLQNATGLTQEHADAMNEQYGIMDNLKFLWSKLSFVLGSVLTPLEPLFAVMTAMGPVMMFMSTSAGRAAIAFIGKAAATMRSHAANILHIGSSGTLTGALTAEAAAARGATTAQIGLNRAMMANPIIAIIAGITALVFWIRHLMNNWTEAANSIEKNWTKFKNFWLGMADKVSGAIQTMTKNVLPEFSAEIGKGREALSGMIDANKIKLDALAAEQAWIDLRKAVKDNAEEMMSSAKMATDQRISQARMTANNEIAELERTRDNDKRLTDERIEFYRDLTEDRLRQIDKQMVAELAAMDASLGKEAQAYLDMLAEQESADEKRNRAIEEDRVAELRAELETDEELTGARKRSLEDQIADYEASWTQKDALSQLYNDIMAGYDEDYFKDLKTEADENFEDQKAIREEQLAAQITVYEADLGAFKEMNHDKLEDLKSFVEQYNKIMAGAGLTSEYEIPSEIIPEERVRPTNPIEFFKWLSKVATGVPGYQHGGPIVEPTLLYGLRSMKPYAIAGEAGREYVTPAGGGGNTININLYGTTIREDADIKRIARELRIEIDRTERRLGISG